jgi:hypothetical protein
MTFSAATSGTAIEYCRKCPHPWVTPELRSESVDGVRFEDLGMAVVEAKTAWEGCRGGSA